MLRTFARNISFLPSSSSSFCTAAAASSVYCRCAPLAVFSHRRCAVIAAQKRTNDAVDNGDDDDNDFVPGAAFGAPPESSPSSSSPSPASLLSSSPSARKEDGALLQQQGVTAAAEQELLGIVRLPDLPEGTRTSRLNKIIEHDPAPRGGSRAASQAVPEIDEVTELLASEESDKEHGARGGSREANNSLPYDDQNFAENILKMDVDGVLDETWQDERNQAKVEDVAAIVDVLRDARCRDICAIDVRAKTSSFDFIVVATCESQRHMTLAGWAVSDADKWQRASKVSRRKADPLWDVVPIGRILVNLMMESYRNDVTVERKWVVTKTMDPLAAAHSTVSESRQLRMHGLWTLTMNLQDLSDFEVDYCKDVLLEQL